MLPMIEDKQLSELFSGLVNVQIETLRILIDAKVIDAPTAIDRCKKSIEGIKKAGSSDIVTLAFLHVLVDLQGHF